MIKNITEILVEQKLDKLLEKEDNCCKCEQCREDMVAYALNLLNPHYVSTDQGQLYTKAKVLSIDYEVEITTALARAIQVVAKHPRH